MTDSIETSEAEAQDLPAAPIVKRHRTEKEIRDRRLHALKRRRDYLAQVMEERGCSDTSFHWYKGEHKALEWAIEILEFSFADGKPMPRDLAENIIAATAFRVKCRVEMNLPTVGMSHGLASDVLHALEAAHQLVAEEAEEVQS